MQPRKTRRFIFHLISRNISSSSPEDILPPWFLFVDSERVKITIIVFFHRHRNTFHFTYFHMWHYNNIITLYISFNITKNQGLCTDELHNWFIVFKVKMQDMARMPYPSYIVVSCMDVVFSSELFARDYFGRAFREPYPGEFQAPRAYRRSPYFATLRLLATTFARTVRGRGFE